jgi:translation initiation factor 3 subunit B
VSQVKKDKLYQFAWRPRPKDLLSPEEKKKVIKNLKKYEKKFAEEDLARKQEQDSTVLAERRALAVQYLAFVRERTAKYASFKAKRVALRDGYDSDDDKHFHVSVRYDEKVISSEKEFLDWTVFKHQC